MVEEVKRRLILITGNIVLRKAEAGFANLLGQPRKRVRTMESEWWRELAHRLSPLAGRISEAKPHLGALRFFALDVDQKVGDSILKRIRDLPRRKRSGGIIDAYWEPGPVRPPGGPRNPFERMQGYLCGAPVGIGAREIWQKGGPSSWHTEGFGVKILLVEQGWSLTHEDLVDSNIDLVWGLNARAFGHGDADLGILVAADNRKGCVGIACKASVKLASQYYRYGRCLRYNTGVAIRWGRHAARLKAGDVILVEAQTRDASGRLIPVEVEPAVDYYIREAIKCGIVVIEAAGNGQTDIDAVLPDPSGAIIVGAASADDNHSRMWYSNYGQSVDCFGWGESIMTCGDGENGTLKNAYRATFGGTSGAAAMVAGAAVLIQSIATKKFGKPLTPSVVRSLLTHRSNTPAAVGARIGVMPDMVKILELMESKSRTGRKRVP